MAEDNQAAGDPGAGVVDQTRGELGWWATVWTWIAGVFFLFVTITNFVHGLYPLPLMPVFDKTLMGFHQFTHWVLDTFLFSWIKMSAAYAWFAITTALSHVFPGIVPVLPRVVIPDWYKDIALVSMVLFASWNRASDLFETPEDTAPHELSAAERWSLSTTTRANIVLTAMLLGISIAFHRAAKSLGAATFFVTRSKFISGSVERAVNVGLAGVCLIGLLLFFSMTVSSFQTRQFSQAEPIRHFVRTMWFTLLSAVLSSVIFFVANGYQVGLR